MVDSIRKLNAVVQSEEFINWILYSVVILIGGCILLFVLTRCFYHHQLSKKESSEIDDGMAEKIALDPYRLLQVLFEILISNTCILSSFWVYCSLMTIPIFQNDFSSYVLLILIVGAIVVNNHLDKKLDQDMLSNNDIGNVRLLSSLSIIVIVGLVWFLYRSDSCQQFLVFYIALVLGRFVFYDTLGASLMEAYEKCAHAFYLVPLMIALIFTFVVFWLGLHFSVITESNIYNSLVLTHLCMALCVHLTKKIENIFW